MMTDPTRSRTALTLRGVTKTIDASRILDGVTFDVPVGQVVGLMGPNGAGKTTLMRSLAGLYELSSGSALVDGHAAGSPEARRALSLMPEDPDLYPGLSVIEHVRLVEGLNRVTTTAQARAALLERYDLADKRDSLPHELSQGMRRKLALILALTKGSRILLLDEPFNGLDPVSSRELRDEVRRLSEQGCTVLISMHGLGDLEKIADRALMLYAGRLVHDMRVRPAEGESGESLEDAYLRVVGTMSRGSA
jgi:ABC-type multidrug transport system ATPase subunit